MNKKILDLLKTKFTGVQESVLSRIADKLAKTALTDEAVTTALEGVTIQTVIDSYADSRVGEATNTAVANYEKKHGIKDGKPAEKIEPQPIPGGDEVPAWAKVILDQNKILTDKLQGFETGRTTDTRRQTLEKKLTDVKAPAAFKSQTLNYLDKLNLSDDEYTQFETEVITNAGVLIQETANAGLSSQQLPFVISAGGGDTKTVETDIKKWAENKNPA